jgi:hypothetical protein
MIMADDQQVAQYLRLRLLAHDYEVLSPQAQPNQRWYAHSRWCRMYCCVTAS